LSDTLKVGKNGVDPLTLQADAGRELMRRVCQTANGFNNDDVLSCAANLLINVLRQAHGSRKKALDAFDEITARSRAVLAEHYDSGGSRRSIFPFNQVISVPLFKKKAN
jgi:hypothetical protein